MSKKERTHEYMCKNILYEYVTGICKGERFYFRAKVISKFTDDGIAITDGEKGGWRVFLQWEQLRRMFDGEAVDVCGCTGDTFGGYDLTECRFVGSDENLADIEKECEQGGITEEDVEETRDFLESKGLLTDRTEDDEPQDSEPTGRRGSDIVRECREAIKNAFSDMIWNLTEYPVRPSATVEVYWEKSRFLTVLRRFEAIYEEMEVEQ